MWLWLKGPPTDGWEKAALPVLKDQCTVPKLLHIWSFCFLDISVDINSEAMKLVYCGGSEYGCPPFGGLAIELFPRYKAQELSEVRPVYPWIFAPWLASFLKIVYLWSWLVSWYGWHCMSLLLTFNVKIGEGERCFIFLRYIFCQLSTIKFAQMKQEDNITYIKLKMWYYLNFWKHTISNYIKYSLFTKKLELLKYFIKYSISIYQLV